MFTRGAYYDTKTFIKKAIKVHGTRYDYSMVEYQKSSIAVKVICRKHGIFTPTPNNHVSKLSGCPTCVTIDKIISLEDYIKIWNKAHNNRYDYSLATTDEKFTVICPEHGQFIGVRGVHHRSGCRKCANKSKRLTNDEFITKAKARHGDRFDYSKTLYQTHDTKVEIICPVHGQYFQMPYEHLKGEGGCQSCSKTGFDPNKPGILYILNSPEHGYTKIGITNRNPHKRLVKVNNSTKKHGIVFNLFWQQVYLGTTTRPIESTVLLWLHNNHKPVSEKFEGYTETFKVDPTEVLSYVKCLIT